MSEKIKVFNPQKFDVGVTMLDKPMGINIKAGSFALMTEDDISYVTSVSTLFQRGILRVDGEQKARMEDIGIDVENDPNFIEDAEIEKKLSLSAKKVEEWIDTINEPFVLDKIFDIAKKMNLNMSKIKVLQAKMPDKNFIEE